MTILTALYLLLKDALWSGVAALGFAILFNVPVRTLFACAFGGALAHLVRTVTMDWGLTIEAATLVGATVAGFLGEVFARRWYAPSTVFTVPSVIPMVPGVYAYNTMIGILHLTSVPQTAGSQVLVETAINGSKTLVIVFALAFGIAAPKLLVYYKKHQVG
jgi:uncharacterized membrane protein YjjB (DUF3815 family)